MSFRYFWLFSICAMILPVGNAFAVTGNAEMTAISSIKDKLVPHKALYDINLVATRSGSQILNISGKMFYEWKPSCEAWITDHRFDLFYEYADSPGMHVMSDFSTYETFDGKSFSYSARRKRDGQLYEELRGQAGLKKGIMNAVFNMPEGLSFDLPEGAMFPMTHTLNMIEHAKNGSKFFNATVFDGSDKEGPVEINAIIGNPVNAMQIVDANENLDMSLINSPAWKVRMAVFPLKEEEGLADYEMSLVFHENGLISDMLIEYDDFSVTQKLVALERIDGDACGSKANVKDLDENNGEKIKKN